MATDRGYPWLKMYPTWLEDYRFMTLSDAAKASYIEFYLIAGRSDSGGLLLIGNDPANIGLLAFAIRKDKDEVKNIVEELIQSTLITELPEGYCISRFQEEQGPAQEDKRKEWKERQDKHRSKVKVKDIALEKEKEAEEDKEEEVTRLSRVTAAAAAAPSPSGKNFCPTCGESKLLDNETAYQSIFAAIKDGYSLVPDFDEELAIQTAQDMVGGYEGWCPQCDLSDWLTRGVECYGSFLEGQRKGEYPMVGYPDEHGRIEGYFGVCHTKPSQGATDDE